MCSVAKCYIIIWLIWKMQNKICRFLRTIWKKNNFDLKRPILMVISRLEWPHKYNFYRKKTDTIISNFYQYILKHFWSSIFCGKYGFSIVSCRIPMEKFNVMQLIPLCDVNIRKCWSEACDSRWSDLIAVNGGGYVRLPRVTWQGSIFLLLTSQRVINCFIITVSLNAAVI